jgi:hypothetical protein
MVSSVTVGFDVVEVRRQVTGPQQVDRTTVKLREVQVAGEGSTVPRRFGYNNAALEDDGMDVDVAELAAQRADFEPRRGAVRDAVGHRIHRSAAGRRDVDSVMETEDARPTRLSGGWS